jgi:hypothetical protein
VVGLTVVAPAGIGNSTNIFQVTDPSLNNILKAWKDGSGNYAIQVGTGASGNFIAAWYGSGAAILSSTGILRMGTTDCGSSWRNNANSGDVTICKDASDVVTLAGAASLKNLSQYVVATANGAQWTHGQSSELLTLSTSGTTTDTAASLLPANSIIEAVVARITTTITTATDWKLGDATIAGRFSAANATLTAGTTQVGLVHVDLTGTSGPRQTAAAKVRVTTTGTPGAGVIRITVFYRQFTAPAN